MVMVVLLLFGSRIPGIARSLGSGITEFRRGLKDGNEKAPDGGEPEVSDNIFAQVLFYSRNLAVPARRKVDDPQVLRNRPGWLVIDVLP